MSKMMLVVPALLFGACDVFEADDEVVLGTVFFHATPPSISIPDSVSAHTPFTVAVRTFGDGCYSFGRTETELDGMVAEIRPYDRRQTGEVCPAILVSIDHSVTLSFGSSGLATVRIIGSRAPGETEDTLEKNVVVR